MKKRFIQIILISLLFNINTYAVTVEFELDPNGNSIEQLLKYTFELNSTVGVYELTFSEDNNNMIIDIPDQKVHVEQIFAKCQSPTVREKILCYGYARESLSLLRKKASYLIFQQIPTTVKKSISFFHGAKIPLLQNDGVRLAGINGDGTVINKIIVRAINENTFQVISRVGVVNRIINHQEVQML